ncbi:MAG TPA: 3-hydroxyacyl-CoA dehydrogenase family protein, partial [Ferruginibacter sp.]|nr:3-hydroxyacyl-CoA dehydrogenase family protein [Ferruginibacter sp.]
MRTVISANDQQWEELPAKLPDIDWIRVDDATAFFAHNDADAYIDLEGGAPVAEYADLKKPVLLNAVAQTLSSIGATSNVVRINAWPGFLQRSTWEVAGEINDDAKQVFAAFQKKIILVADEPGFVSARVIAMIINEAFFAAGENVSSRSDIDTAMKLGTNYPFGPFEWGHSIGLQNILELLQQLTAMDKRYQP